MIQLRELFAQSHRGAFFAQKTMPAFPQEVHKMGVDFKNSETKDNLMRAFAGESQARNRYTFAAQQAKKENLYVVSAVFE